MQSKSRGGNRVLITSVLDDMLTARSRGQGEAPIIVIHLWWYAKIDIEVRFRDVDSSTAVSRVPWWSFRA